MITKIGFHVPDNLCSYAFREIFSTVYSQQRDKLMKGHLLTECWWPCKLLVLELSTHIKPNGMKLCGSLFRCSITEFTAQVTLRMKKIQ